LEEEEADGEVGEAVSFLFGGQAEVGVA